VTNYNPIRTLTYSKRIKYGRKGAVNIFKYHGKEVKAYLSPSGRRLDIIDAPPSIIPKLQQAEEVIPYKDRLHIRYPKKPKQPKPKPKPEEQLQKTEPEQKTEEKKTEPKPKPRPPTRKPHFPITDEDREKAKLVPVPDTGPIPTPYIDWNNIPEHCKISGIVHYDYPVPGASKGMLPALRKLFGMSRRYQNEIPVNVLIQGPKGTGKSQLIKKFADDAGLPYWGVIGQEGIRADELLGHYELKEGTSKWVDGLIPRAIKAGGILHIDEANVIEPAILMRLDELLDNKRQLNMEDLNGEIIKSHPDLFIIFTMNPPTYEGVKPLPDPIISRLTKRFKLDYPPKQIEYKIIEAKLRAVGVKPSEFRVEKGMPKGRFAQEVVDFMKVIDGLRRDQDLMYTPSIRETIGFVQDLKEGADFHTAFDTNVKGYYWGEDETKVEEALQAVRRR